MHPMDKLVRMSKTSMATQNEETDDSSSQTVAREFVLAA